MRIPRTLSVATAVWVATASIVVSAGPVLASRVCIPFLTGTQCVVFLEGRPTKPGLSKGMTISISPDELTLTNELTVTMKGFKPNEGLRRFNYNIFGQGRMNEYGGEFRRADKRGNFTWIVAPSTAIYEPSWGNPAVCAVGQRSGRLACIEFKVAADGAGDAGSSPGQPTPAPTQSAVPAPAVTPTPTPSPTASASDNCRDVGFAILCTS